MKKAAARLSDWFAIQSLPLKAGLLAVALMIPASGLYALALAPRSVHWMRPPAAWNRASAACALRAGRPWMMSYS